MIGRTRESTQEDLFTSIDKGDFPKWKVQVQIMPELDADKTPYNPFDLTKVWPHADYPPIDIGIMELNRNPENYFTEIENAAFSPSNIVPGISYSPDKMLQARIFSYADAHRHRLGTHYESIPVNQPKCPVHHYHRDGQMNVYGGIKTGNPDAYYEPNSFNGPVEQPSARSRRCVSLVMPLAMIIVWAMTITQPRALFNLFDGGRNSVCSPTLQPQWAVCRASSLSVSSVTSSSSIPTMRPVCARP